MDELAYIMQTFNINSIPKHNAPIVLSIDRVGLAALFYALGYVVGAEIGVAEGYYSETLCKFNPKLEKLYCIDAWTSYPKYMDFGGFRLGEFYNEAKKRLEPYNCEFIKGFSMDVVRQFDKSLDFVYIDAAHDFLSVTQDISAWSKKVRKGGIVAGHDYRRDTNPDWKYHVKDVVPAWVHAYRISPWFLTRESPASWFWVVK